MKLISRRRVPAFLGCAGLFAASIVLAAPVDAFPAKAWWYGQLGIAKAQQVSRGAGVTVAVVDTGVQAGLGDLRGQVRSGITFIGGDPLSDPPGKDNKYAGHGTAMAAYIAGTGKGAGLVGVAPAAKILPVRVANNVSGADEPAMVKGIEWAAAHGAKVINVSEAGQSSCPPDLQAAVDYAVRRDAIIVAGTGNRPDLPVGFPANCVGAIAVGGLAYANSFAPWSGASTGPALDFVAPAQHMLQLLLDDTLSNPDSNGTSNATALVSGIFALMRAKFPHDSARQIVTRALYNVHNGLAGNVFAKRVNDRVGYGEILANYALTDAPPKNAVNPIYDAIDKHLKSTSSGASPTSTGPARSGATSGSPSASSSGNAGGSSGVSPGVVGLIIVVVVLVAVGIIVAVTRSRRRPSGFGPPGGHP